MSNEEFTGLGFAPGSVRGVRSFAVDKFGRLTGVVYKKVWTPGENSAECLKDSTEYGNGRTGAMTGLLGGTITFSPSVFQTYTSVDSGFGKRGKGKPKVVTAEVTEKAVPQHTFEDCRCGFYGYFDGSDDYHDNGRITAVVEAYGETVIGTRGFRAMKARILAIRVKAEDDGVNGAMARKISNNYKGVAIFDTFDAMVSEFPPDTSLEPSPDTDPDFWTRT